MFWELRKNIILATDAYPDNGPGFQDKNHIDAITVVGLHAIELQLRTEKALEEQQARTRKKSPASKPKDIGGVVHVVAYYFSLQECILCRAAKK